MRRVLFVASAVALALGVTRTSARADEDTAALQALLAKRAPSIVTVTAVVKSEMQGGGQSSTQESRLSLLGVVVAPDGLVMVTNAPFSLKRMGVPPASGAAAGTPHLKNTPTSFKVTVPGEIKPYDAFVAATDTTLDLAFLKLEGLGEKRLTAVDFAGSADTSVGQRVYVLTRLSRGYDFAPCFVSARICGELVKPRKAWIVEGGSSRLGLPAFEASGAVIGVMTALPAGAADEGSGDDSRFSAMMEAISGQDETDEDVFLVPAASVKALIEQASQKAVEVAAERAKKKPAKPKG